MNVILYVIDALRADSLSCYGFDKRTSPNIDALAQDSVLYENAYATATWTKASAASIVTSQHPRSIKMMHEMDVLPENLPTLPKLLRQNGYKTYAISANAFFSPDFGFTGFDEFYVLQKEKEIVEKTREAKNQGLENDEALKKVGIQKLVVPHSEEINAKAIPLLRPGESQDRFIMIWSADAHGPYYVKGRKSFFGNALEDFIFEKDVHADNLPKAKSLYCDMIRHNDGTLGGLILAMKDAGLYEESMIIVTADHGDSFGDHSLRGRPLIGHGGIAYQEVIKVPLLIKYPNNQHAGLRYLPPVQLIDIFPSIADVCGIELSFEVEGLSLSPSRGDISTGRPIFVESQMTPESTYSAAAIEENRKLICAHKHCPLYFGPDLRKAARSLLCKLRNMPSVELYDLSADPGEQRNLARRLKPEARSLRSRLTRIKAACEEKATSVQKPGQPEIDEGVKNRLKALGYLD